MIVLMVVGISGSRNDSSWPPRGGKLEVPDAEGRDLINAGLAVDTGEVAPEPEPEPETEPETEPGDDEPGDETEPEQVTGAPKPVASKQDWIDWAVSQGAEWVTATNATKQQLMEQYGQRT